MLLKNVSVHGQMTQGNNCGTTANISPGDNGEVRGGWKIKNKKIYKLHSLPRPKLWGLRTIPHADGSLLGDSEGSQSQFHQAAGVMISCPAEYILSVSHMTRSLYPGHKFHSRTQAGAVHGMPGFITCKQITSLSVSVPTALSSQLSIALLFSFFFYIAFAVAFNCLFNCAAVPRQNPPDGGRGGDVLCNTEMPPFTGFVMTVEVPQWNYPHLLKMSIRSTARLMK